jgi:hypothetical protein
MISQHLALDIAYKVVRYNDAGKLSFRRVTPRELTDVVCRGEIHRGWAVFGMEEWGRGCGLLGHGDG